MKVTIYQTVATGQDVVGTIALEGSDLVFTGRAENLWPLLSDRAGQAGFVSDQDIMKYAPFVLDGGYLRAAFEE